jgi:KDO2-lipid IV(A) lauroyltransferase
MYQFTGTGAVKSDGFKMGNIILGMVFKIFEKLSWNNVQKAGRVVGIFFYYFFPIRKKIVLSNLNLALPQLKKEHKRIAKEQYSNMGQNIFEMFKMATASGLDILKLIKIEGWQNYLDALENQKGIIVVTAHFGNFDLLACSQAAKGVPLAIISKQLHSSKINNTWMKIRKRFGLTIFYDRTDAKKIVKWLRDGNVLGIVIDQRTSPEKGGVEIPFFNQPVWTSTASARLALRTGAALLPVHIYRDNVGHTMVIDRQITVESTENNFENIKKISLLLNSCLENWIRTSPGQWMWMHRRFVGKKGYNL